MNYISSLFSVSFLLAVSRDRQLIMGLFIYFLLSAIALCYLLVKKRYNFWNNKGILSAPTTFPFGSLKGIGTSVNFAEGMDKYYKEYKGKAKSFGLFFFFQPTLVPLDPELVKDIFVRDFTSFHDRGFYHNKKDDPSSANILTLDGQEWRDRRVKMTPIFTSGKMKMMFDIVDMISDRLINVVDENSKTSKKLDMKEYAGRYTADVIGNVAFGLECNCLTETNSEFLKHGRRLFDPTPFELIKFFFASSCPNLARKLKLRANPKEASDFFMETFFKTLEYREKNNYKRTDFVQLLLGLRGSFTISELAAESFLVYAGGFETSATLTTFTLYEMALNPDMQEKLRSEIKTGIEENDGKFSYDMLFGLEYLDKVVKESLRKYPPIPNNSRKCSKEYQIPGTKCVIPVGTSIEIPTYSFHHDPEYFPEPSKFDPERFSPENCEKRHQFVYIPFGEGPRNCLGMRFGLMQSKLGIAKLLLNYEFSPNEKTPIPMKFIPSAPFLAPVGGMWLNIEKLSD